MMEPVSVAHLALELNVAQDEIEDYLRSEWSVDLDWADLRDDAAEAVRETFREVGAAQPLAWRLCPGDRVRRRAIHAVYGGQQQGGISTPRSIPDVLVFTDPSAGAKYGYDAFEGLREDGSYAYTGEGQIGDQTFKSGNRAIRDATSHGKAIRILRTKGVFATYIGAFTTGEPPYELKTIPDINGNPRRGIIFNLLPLAAKVELLPAYGGELEPEESLVDYAASPRVWTPPEFDDVVIPANDEISGERVVSRVEFELQSAFGTWLSMEGTPPARLPLRAGSTVIEPDFYVPDRRWIVEAKRSTARGYIRTAIGQVLDYANVASRAGLPVEPVVLLPGAPERDLLELMQRLGILVVIRDDSGAFRQIVA